MTQADGSQALLAELDQYSFSGIDFEELGRMVIAALLREKRDELGSGQQVDGFLVADASVAMSIRVRPPASDSGTGPAALRPEICCVCVRDFDGVIICRGMCCPGF